MALQVNVAPNVRLEPGVWQGEYLDVRGIRGKLRFELRSVENGVTGEFELRLVSHGRPVVHTGEVQGKVDGSDLRMTLRGQEEVLEYNAQLRDAGSYAKQAMIGTVLTSPRSEGAGGVWIAWRFARD
jgi:hypothetical protein